MVDQAQIDKDGNGILFNGSAKVERIENVAGQRDVFLLQAVYEFERSSQICPRPGQFYMIRTKTSNGYFKRPISVYHSEEFADSASGKRMLRLQFLILQKGEGTKELCSLKVNDDFLVQGPLGNEFALTPELKDSVSSTAPSAKREICIVGGGIGVAPVANFASSLPATSYDFYACFKSGTYGLEYVKGNTIITTDDGSAGIKGMLPTALTAQKIKECGYKAIYACGPTPMLVYVQKVARECGIKAFLSMEHRMLCGAGACLGCTISTTQGSLRVCKDGPVFDSDIIQFEAPCPRRTPLAENQEVDLSVDMCGIHFENPLFAAAGTFGFGQNFRGFADVNDWGAICSKGTTLEERQGNEGERCIEVPSGDINSIGLQNPGIRFVTKEIIPQMLKLKPVAILNLAGGSIESYVEAAKIAEESAVPMIELNISCPNVKAGGMAWGTDPKAAFECVSAVRAVVKKPLMVKLSPNAPDLRAVAMACVEAGADALSLINTIQSMAIDVDKGRPFFKNVRAGLCGPAVRPIALRMVYDVVQEMNKLPVEKRVPVVGIGGIATWHDAVEFIMAGAHAVQIGSAIFANPNVAKEILCGLKAFMKSHGYANLEEMRGIAQ